MEAAREGWVEIVKKNIKKEVQKDAQVMQSTFDEEKMRRIRRLNIRVLGVLDTTVISELEGRNLCNKLGIGENEPLPFLRA